MGAANCLQCNAPLTFRMDQPQLRCPHCNFMMCTGTPEVPLAPGVAAGGAAVDDGVAASEVAQGVRRSGLDLSAPCSRCRSRQPDVLFLPCAHIAACSDCIDEILRKAPRCPRCSAPIKAVQKVYY